MSGRLRLVWIAVLGGCLVAPPAAVLAAPVGTESVPTEAEDTAPELAPAAVQNRQPQPAGEAGPERPATQPTSDVRTGGPRPPVVPPSRVHVLNCVWRE